MYMLFFISARGKLRSWLPAMGPSRAPAPPRASTPSFVDLDAAADQAISTGGGEVRDFLGVGFEELRTTVSKGYSRGYSGVLSNVRLVPIAADHGLVARADLSEAGIDRIHWQAQVSSIEPQG